MGRPVQTPGASAPPAAGLVPIVGAAPALSNRFSTLTARTDVYNYDQAILAIDIRYPPHPMDLKQLEYFVRVAELGSFTRAAQALDVAQPALSRQVRLLEVELRQNLLLRNG